jgi:hypothetical protein
VQISKQVFFSKWRDCGFILRLRFRICWKFLQHGMIDSYGISGKTTSFS